MKSSQKQNSKKTLRVEHQLPGSGREHYCGQMTVYYDMNKTREVVEILLDSLEKDRRDEIQAYLQSERLCTRENIRDIWPELNSGYCDLVIAAAWGKLI
ncbi:MAG: hypothetical protein AAGI37_09120 [Planctomycetota bacterium]